MNVWRNPEINRLVVMMSCVTIPAVIVAFVIRIAAGIWVTAVCIAFWLVIFLFMRVRYRAISKLSLELDRVLHNSLHLPPDEHDEGELSVLRSEIGKMTLTLRRQAEALEKDKVYLANSMSDISHQLKTPLASMYLLLSFLQKNDADEQRRWELLRDFRKLLEHTNWLVASLLKISKLDSGTAYLKQESVSVHTLVQMASEPLLIPMDLRNQTLDLLCNEAKFVGDLLWSAEAIGNILKNCMEHTPSGGCITVRAWENAIFTGIEISDNGQGIHPDDLPHIFERFYVGKNPSENSVGIGLALAHMIIREQNGTISVENRTGGGTCFRIKFYKTVV